jgi:hypothetical protein
VLTLIVFNMLQNPDMEKELRRELQPLYAPDPNRIPSFRELEKLPYLSGCLKDYGVYYSSQDQYQSKDKIALIAKAVSVPEI